MKPKKSNPARESRTESLSNDLGQAKPYSDTCPQAGFTQAIPLGKVVLTRGASDAFVESGAAVLPFLIRHSAGDWGEVSEADRQENDLSVEEGNRLLSAYRLPKTGVKIWIITEADRSLTTLLLPEDY